MAAIQVYGMNPLEGEISVQGSKNGALPIMAGALLHKGTTVLYNVPDIEDTRCMTDILREIGCRCVKTGSRLVIDAVFVDRTEVPGKYVKAMRSSIILLGALLGRMKEGRCSFPGGCLIGARPVDLHLMVLEKLGAIIEEEDGHRTFLSQCRRYGTGRVGSCSGRWGDSDPQCGKRTGDQPVMSFLKWHGCCDLWDGNRASDGPGSKKTSRQCMENRRGPDRSRDLQYGSYGSRGKYFFKRSKHKTAETSS